jgi:RNA recognition motif-containing protein
MNIQISNLDLNLKDEQLKELFAFYGNVRSAEIAIDSFTGRSRGFGFVDMPVDAEAQNAIKNLNNSQFHDHIISVKETRPKEEHKGSYKVGNGPIREYRFKKNK